MSKKIIIYIIIIAVIFCGGFLAGGIGPGKRATELERQTAELGKQLKTEADRNTFRTKLLTSAASTIGKLQGEIDNLTNRNKYLVDKLAGIGSGFNGDIQTVSEIRKGMEQYIEKAKTAETIDSN